MNFSKKVLLLAMSGLVFTSCNDDDDNPIVTPGDSEPTSYVFTRDGESTVSFGGQNTRIQMANEILSAMMDPMNTEESLESMLKHTAGNADFSDADLNSSGKNIYSKLAASIDYFSTNTADSEEVKETMLGFLEEQADEVFPRWNDVAIPGEAGQFIVGEKTRYVNSLGLEMNQMFAKSLIGSLMADQALNNYLSTATLDAGSNRDNNDNEVVEDGKNFTTMEHKWDEAYGYVFGGDVVDEANVLNPDQTHNNFLHKYLLKVDSNPNFSGIAEDVFDSFKKGRFAITEEDYSERDRQASSIKEDISTVIAVRAVHYLQSGKQAIEENPNDRHLAFHDLSEGIGFLYSLQFTQNPNTNQAYLSGDEVEDIFDYVLDEDGLWSVTPEELQMASEEIANAFPFTVEEAR